MYVRIFMLFTFNRYLSYSCEINHCGHYLGSTRANDTTRGELAECQTDERRDSQRWRKKAEKLRDIRGVYLGIQTERWMERARKEEKQIDGFRGICGWMRRGWILEQCCQRDSQSGVIQLLKWLL